MKAILKVEGIKKYYGKRGSQTKALDGVSFQVMPGEFLGIMGSSGSGKTTLLNCLSTVIAPTDGKVFLEGKEVQSLQGEELACYRGKRTGYLFQNFELIDHMTGKENILLPASLHGVSEEAVKKRMLYLVDQMSIQSVMDKFPSQMSGGQRQRVAAARALLLEPQIVFADEPTGALDSKNAKILMEHLQKSNQKDQSTILMVTHDFMAASYCNRILFIQDGKLFHEIRRDIPRETRDDFYQRILSVMARMGGGIENV